MNTHNICFCGEKYQCFSDEKTPSYLELYGHKTKGSFLILSLA